MCGGRAACVGAHPGKKNSAHGHLPLSRARTRKLKSRSDDAARATRRGGRRRWGDYGLDHAAMARAENARRAQGTPATAAVRRRPPSPFYARAVRIAAEPCGALVVREGAKALQLQTSADHCGAGATGLEPATSGVTGRETDGSFKCAPRRGNAQARMA